MHRRSAVSLVISRCKNTSPEVKYPVICANVFKGSWIEFARLDGMLQAPEGMFDNKWQDNWHDTGRVSVCRINLLMKNRGIGNLDLLLISDHDLF